MDETGTGLGFIYAIKEDKEVECLWGMDVKLVRNAKGFCLGWQEALFGCFKELGM